MKEYQFSVDDPMGAVRMTHYSKWTDPRAKRYAQYKRRVRLIANVAGVPDIINDGERASVDIDIYWKGAAKVDADNVLKAVIDSLWRQDRKVNAIRAASMENIEKAVCDSVNVTVRIRSHP